MFQFKVFEIVAVAVISISLLGGLGVYIHNLKSEIDFYKDSLNDTKLELANIKLESNRYKTVLEEQTKEISLLQSSKKIALEKLIRWRNKKPAVKYKVIEKIRKVKSNVCEDIKDTIDSIKYIDYKLL